MDLRRIRYFVTVAETLHFGRAAERLNIAQPPLSQQIRVLENELNVRLFDRTNRQVELTQAGGLLLPEARALLAQADRIETTASRVQQGALGELHIGLTSAGALTPVIRKLILAYRRAFPGVALRIQELTTQEQLSATLDRKLDIAFIRSNVTPSLPPTLHAKRLVKDALVVALPLAHPFAADPAPLAVQALAAEPFIMFPSVGGTGVYDQIIALCFRAGFVPQVEQEAQAATTMIGLVAAGLGVALVPSSFKGIAVDEVAFRDLADPGAKSAMWIVMRKDATEHEDAFWRLAKAV